ncbi:cytochrome b/b6 domain-containing protein [Sphingomonas qilianensis]|uniref:Cytochrome b/b6 domain-containing protein n=1 Tax=Sphingomonas qilianensis TaxID=1736690 RepID=A0ABU9XST7_9SPHN
MNRAAIATTRTKNTIQVWDLPVRLFHWLLVATILVAFLSAEEESALAPWHVPAGWLATLLIVFRLMWGFVGGEHARFARFVKPGQIGHHLTAMLSPDRQRSVGHNALGGVAILALLATVAAVVYTGVTMNGDAGEGLHETLANILLGLIAVHVLAVVMMSLLTRDNLIGAFVTGRKRADLHPGVTDAAPPMTIALPLAGVALGLAAYGVTTLDPVAFTPGAHVESAEAGDESGDDD